MRVIVCGGRNYKNFDRLEEVLDNLDAARGPFDIVVTGAAPGADFAAQWWAMRRGKKYQAFPADWLKHGRAAGPIRNQAMLDSGADLLVAFPGGRGTQDMVRRAEKAGLQVLRVS